MHPYRSLCQKEKTIPLFSRDWWLDVVCGKENWDVLWVEENGQIQATMPLYIPHKGIISMPPFTQTMGPWLAPVSDDTKYTSLLAHRQAIVQQLIRELNTYPYFLQNFNYAITDWLPFYWEGYRQTTRYTYLLNDISDPERVWADMSHHTRRNIHKAQEKRGITVKRGISTEEFLSVYRKTFERQGLPARHQQTLTELIHTCRVRQQGDVWGGFDPEGNLHAAVFVAWQESSAYYLAGGGDPAYRDSGAHSLLLWETIRFVADKSERFDFEGSMIRGVERFFREFGAIQTPYFTISRGNISLLHRAWLKIKNHL